MQIDLNLSSSTFLSAMLAPPFASFHVDQLRVEVEIEYHSKLLTLVLKS